jgi:hypothetical protein
MKQLSVFIVLSIILSCSTSKSKSKSQENTPVQEANSAPVPASEQNEIANFTVSFISKGSGIDTKAKREFQEFLQQYTSAQSKKIEYREVFWGREGEVDYCLFLQTWSAKDQESIKEEIKAKRSNSTLVRFFENALCKKR